MHGFKPGQPVMLNVAALAAGNPFANAAALISLWRWTGSIVLLQVSGFISLVVCAALLSADYSSEHIALSAQLNQGDSARRQI
ncbi:hypothetical protein WH43_09705 [Rheinheimera sp. KL1]|nr:hypothetical protein WH43_09705 [Rheinheimera sp. KL1]